MKNNWKQKKDCRHGPSACLASGSSEFKPQHKQAYKQKIFSGTRKRKGLIRPIL
jgi:hypothetical protein